MASPAYNAHILNINNSWYDLRKVVSWSIADDPKNVLPAGSLVSVVFESTSPHHRLLMDKTTFETAKAASISAGG